MPTYENKNRQLNLIDGNYSQDEIKGFALDSAGALVAPIEKTSTASQAYAVGKQFVYNGLLTEATSAIAQGATITVGSGGNAKLADCVSDQIASLKASLNDYIVFEAVQSPSYTVAPNSTVDIYITPPTKAGYKPVCAWYKTSNVTSGIYASDAVSLLTWDNNTKFRFTARNIGSSSVTGSYWSIVAYIRI